MKSKAAGKPAPSAPARSKKARVSPPEKKPTAKMGPQFARGTRAKDDARRVTAAGKARSK